MKTFKHGKTKLFIAEHKGDIIYLNYVKFKQYVPQFWEKMDSPLFAVYLEKIQDLFNQSKFIQAYNVLMDYKVALDNSENSYDAWGICFALIAYESEAEAKKEITDVQIKEKLEKWEWITPEVIVDHVVDFMKASPETFQDHLALYGLLNMMSETDV